MAMRRRLTQVVLAATLASFASASPARAQQSDDDHALVFELGVVVEGEPDERVVHSGGTFAVEVTPIEHWLELEIGVTAVRADGSTEVPIDVLFKKPWRISRTFEFMIGAGPEIVHVTGRESSTYLGFSAVLDFMFWPRRNIGWYVEPGYEATFQDSATHHGWGVAAGLLLGR
jgi:hypothetical protein